MHQINIEHLKNIFFAITLSLALAKIDLILGVDSSDIKDRVNYLKYVIHIDYLLQSIKYNSELVFFEPLFLCVVYVFNIICLTPLYTINAIVFVSATVAFLMLLQKGSVNFFWSLVIFLFPWFLVSYLMNLRQGLAIGVFLIGWFLFSGKQRIFILLLTPLIHYSFYFILISLLIIKLLATLRINPRLTVLLSLATGISQGFMVFYLSPYLVPDQLSGLYTDIGAYFGMGFIFWAVIFLTFFIQNNDFIKTHLFPIFGIGNYLGAVIIFSPFSRVLQNIVVFVLIAGFSLNG